MRTTIDIPDVLFKRIKVTAAARGISLKDLVVRSIEREISSGHAESKRRPSLHLPVIHLEAGKVMDLTGFDFDDLLA